MTSIRYADILDQRCTTLPFPTGPQSESYFPAYLSKVFLQLMRFRAREEDDYQDSNRVV